MESNIKHIYTYLYIYMYIYNVHLTCTVQRSFPFIVICHYEVSIELSTSSVMFMLKPFQMWEQVRFGGQVRGAYYG